MTVNPGFGGQAFCPKCCPKSAGCGRSATSADLICSSKSTPARTLLPRHRRLRPARMSLSPAPRFSAPTTARRHRRDSRERPGGSPLMSAQPVQSSIEQDALKRVAAEAGVGLVQAGMIVGLETGSTAAFAIEALGRRNREGLRFIAIPTSERTAAQARSAGISLASFAEHHRIDLTIDGADEVERGSLNLIKGRGSALLREKSVAAASRQLTIIVDETKLVARVPVEVVAFGLEATRALLEVLGAHVDSIAALHRSPTRRGWSVVSAVLSACSNAGSSLGAQTRSSSAAAMGSIVSTACALTAAARRSS